MARARNIKPAFFANETLGGLAPLTRLLFIGLWTIADREGRLEDRPLRIKAGLLPYDNCDANQMLSDLDKHGFIIRYVVDGVKLICIPKWHKHQNPHVKEAASILPAPDQHQTSTRPASEIPALAVLIPSSLIPDSLNLIPDSPKTSFNFSQKNELQNQQPASPEDSTLEPDSPPIAVAPSRDERLDQDAEFTRIRPITAKHVFSRLKSNRGRTIKASTWAKGKITDAIEKLDANIVSEEMVLDVVEAFLKEDFWSDFHDPALALPKYLANADFTATQVKFSEPEPTSESPRILERVLEPLIVKSPKLPEYAERWNAFMPKELQIRFDLSPFVVDRLFDAGNDREFRECYDQLLESCLRLHQGGRFKIKNFDWLFSTSSKKDINWRRVLHGDFAFLETPEVKTQPKSPGEIAREKYEKFLEKEKLNGKNGSEPTKSGGADSSVLGVPVRNANDAERDPRLGKGAA